MVGVCSFCDHGQHDGGYCLGSSPCDCGTDHRCACSYPDPSNYAELPA